MYNSQSTSTTYFVTFPMAWLVLTFDASFGISCRAFVNFRRDSCLPLVLGQKKDPILVASFDVLVQGPENKTILIRQDLPKTSTTWSNPNMENWSRDIGYKEKSKRKDLTILVSMDFSSL